MTASRKSLPNKIFRAEVVETNRLTTGMLRVTFGGPGLQEFLSTGVGDEYLRVFLPADGQNEPTWPFPNSKGQWLLVDRCCRRRGFPLAFANRPASAQVGNGKHCNDHD